ncbi:MAG: CBS domain-containing protein [Nitrososphaerales archaeon]|jgi:hypothetical protein
MKLNEALPSLFRRPFPLLEAGTRVLLAGTLLDTPRRDVLKVTGFDESVVKFSAKKERSMVFSGYTLLARLLEIDHEKYYNLLYDSCERASIYTQPIASNVELATVLEEFARTKFGWSLVEEGGKYDVVSLSDLISLYQIGTLETDLTVSDVASPEIFSMPSDTYLRRALQVMMKHRIRRIFLSDYNHRFVSDREILSYIFSPERLSIAREDPTKMLAATLEDVGPVEAIEVEGSPTIKKISRHYKPESGAWCLICSKGLVTPWDLVVKPWNMGRLVIREYEKEESHKNWRVVK